MRKSPIVSVLHLTMLESSWTKRFEIKVLYINECPRTWRRGLLVVILSFLQLSDWFLCVHCFLIVLCASYFH